MINWIKLDGLWDNIDNDIAFSDLRIGKNRLVPGEGDNPKAILIGEAPGAQEAMHLRPFVGPAGLILRQLMHIANLRSDNDQLYGLPDNDIRYLEPNCWLTNVIKYRPPRNRTPTWAEITLARPYLRREYSYIGKPRLAILIGGTALSAYYGKQMSIMKMAGIPDYHPKANPRLAIWPMLHPAFGIHNESVRPLMEKHWEALARWMADDHNQRFISG